MGELTSQKLFHAHERSEPFRRNGFFITKDIIDLHSKSCSENCMRSRLDDVSLGSNQGT
jgi:hypothetical protein